ncbi:flippase-like domain-containing protein [Thioclava sp. BHET1]|nr:flippase-like domain-containing protein [Thioclava sp. BHET1]
MSYRPLLLRLGRMLLPLGVLAVVLSLIDPGAALSRIASARIWPLLGALALAQLVILGSAWRWQVTVQALGQALPRRHAVGEYYLASLFNIVLPGGVGGDALRVWRGRVAHGTGPALRGVMIERFSGQVTLALVLLAGLGGSGALDGSVGLVAVFVAGLACLGALLVFGARLPGPPGRALAGFGVDLRRLARDGRAMGQLLALNLIVVAALIGSFWLCTRAVGTEMPLSAALIVIPLCLAAMLVPAGLGGLGLREGAAAALWPLAGFAADAGVATSLLFGLVHLVAALPALYLLARPHSGADRRAAR